jgi:hypothetical protein
MQRGWHLVRGGGRRGDEMRWDEVVVDSSRLIRSL